MKIMFDTLKRRFMLSIFLDEIIAHHYYCFCFCFQRIHFVSDPCTLLVNNVTIGLSSMDVLLHLGSEETVW